MYVVTFYSFKGGVGRTLALVNIAFQLAQQGKRVLMVDFDLEAPGLDTFDLSPASGRTPGVVEYVSTYIASGQPPSIEKFLFEVSGGSTFGGQLYTMPSGLRDETYEARLRDIDWQKLYAESDGYLMIENLKAQWQASLRPDYVLLDSRTGHTDVAGICTRQLPDAVTILFLPNEQNLRGLKKIVSDIRAEAKPPRNRPIQQFFVMSNVPDLDDEDSILARRLAAFRKELNFKDLAQTIHTYPSLSLLDQSVFTRTHPKSKLALQYRSLSELIISNNPEDREGAIRYLKGLTEGSIEEDDSERLKRIATAFASDTEILRARAVLLMKRGAYKDAMPLLDAALELGDHSSEILLRRADCRMAVGDRSLARADIEEALNLGNLNEHQVIQALTRLRETDEEMSQLRRDFGSTKALVELQPRMKALAAHLLSRSRQGLLAASDLLRAVVNDPTVPADTQLLAHGQLALVLIGLGEFQESIEELSKTEPHGIEQTRSIQNAFNYAMAAWGLKRIASKKLFERVVELHRQSQPREGANYPQCMAIAYWAIGDLENANAQLDLAEKRAAAIRQEDMSCWRYLTVKPIEFFKDLTSIRLMLSGKNVEPQYFRSASEL